VRGQATFHNGQDCITSKHVGWPALSSGVGCVAKLGHFQRWGTNCVFGSRVIPNPEAGSEVGEDLLPLLFRAMKSAGQIPRFASE